MIRGELVYVEGPKTTSPNKPHLPYFGIYIRVLTIKDEKYTDSFPQCIIVSPWGLKTEELMNIVRIEEI